MQLTTVVVAALAASANALQARQATGTGGSGATTITQVVTGYVTNCPAPTTFAANNQTYTVTSSTKVTVACPSSCTISYNPANPSVVPIGSTFPYTNGTSSSGSGKGSGSGSSGSGSGSGSGSSSSGSSRPATVSTNGVSALEYSAPVALVSVAIAALLL